MIAVKVKICGLTNYEDAFAAADMGADMLGFNFYPKSPRYITPEDALKIIDRLPAYVDIVGLFVNDTFDHIKQVVEQCNLDWIQFHGDEKKEFVEQFRPLNAKTIKAIRVKDETDIKLAEEYFTDAILLDAFDPKKYGVIVKSGERRGLLLPDLEGIDTAEEQIRIAAMKACIYSAEGIELYRFEVKRYS